MVFTLGEICRDLFQILALFYQSGFSIHHGEGGLGGCAPVGVLVFSFPLQKYKTSEHYQSNPIVQNLNPFFSISLVVHVSVAGVVLADVLLFEYTC